MRHSLFFAVAVAALANAQHGLPDGAEYSCAKPNANYCLGGDIILRCDGNSVGTPGRCSPNLSGYPPQGGTAICWQSEPEAGDAACEKNCVVYAEEPFTLSPDECEPTHTATHTESTTREPIPTLPFPNTTTIITTYTTTQCPSGCSHPPPPPPHPTGSPPPPGTGSPPPPPGNGTATAPPPGSTGGEPTNIPQPPPSTSAGPVPTGAAASNKAGTLLAAIGIMAAYFV